MSQRLALSNRRSHITQKVRIARLMSLALQYGAPLEKVGNLLAGTQFAPCGPVCRLTTGDHLPRRQE